MVIEKSEAAAQVTDSGVFDGPTMLVHAAAVAAQLHVAQRRKNPSGEPYINHPLRVADILRAAGVDDYFTLGAALLHDVIEDTDMTQEELAREVGQKILDVVLMVSDDKSLPAAVRKRKQVDSAQRMVDFIGDCYADSELETNESKWTTYEATRRAIYVKMADKIDNLEDLLKQQPGKWSKERVVGYFVWAKAVTDNLLECVYAESQLHERLARALHGTIQFADGETIQLTEELYTPERLEDYYRLIEQES